MNSRWVYLILSLATLLCLPISASAQQVSCDSRDYQQEFCPAGVTITRAWILVQRSRSPCIEGQTWGYQNKWHLGEPGMPG
jgi:hypothetical protein